MTQPSITVLIAEDDPVFRRVMGFSIARSGLTVESVGDGQAAYERLCSGGIDFLVTDHQMPICSGLELLDKVAADSSIQCPPTILCTAKGLELDGKELETRYSLLAIMHKPFSPRKLCQLILEQVGMRPVDPSIAATHEATDPPNLTSDSAANVNLAGSDRR